MTDSDVVTLRGILEKNTPGMGRTTDYALNNVTVEVNLLEVGGLSPFFYVRVILEESAVMRRSTLSFPGQIRICAHGLEGDNVVVGWSNEGWHRGERCIPTSISDSSKTG